MCVSLQSEFEIDCHSLIINKVHNISSGTMLTYTLHYGKMYVNDWTKKINNKKETLREEM